MFKSSLDDFKKAALESGLASETKIVYLMHGDTYEFVIDKTRLGGAL